MFNAPIKILVVEDNPGDFLLVKEYLVESLAHATVLQAPTLNIAEAILLNEKVDVVLLDLTLPDAMGLDTFHEIYAKAPEIPIIVLTGFGDTDVALEALKHGAQDYLVKDDVNPTVLAKSITYGIERSKIRAHLKQSEKQYRYLFYSNPLPMFAVKKDSSKFLMVNQAAVKHYGYSEEEFLEMHLYDIRPKNGIYQGNFDPDKDLDTTDIKHRKADGTIIDVELGEHDILLQGENETLIVIHDVTERNNAKEELRVSEQMFRTISENFPNGAVAILNRELIVLYTAGKDYHIPEAGSSFIEETEHASQFTEPPSVKIRKNLEEVFKGNTIVFEAMHGSLSYIISAVPLFEKDNTINKILLATQNISEQKKNEYEKELLIEELMHNNNDLKQFSYITSHNLRAPLSNLLGIIQLLDMSLITDPTTSLLLKNFKECTLQLNDTVNDLINVLIIKNNVNTKKEALDIDTTFNKILHSVQTSVSNMEAQVSTNFSEASIIQFNRSYLESILLNLLTNALKYSSPDRKPEIKVSTKPFRDGVKLYFSDNGLGIDLDRHRDKIFGLYQRFHDHADSKGLGLYMVNSQVRALGGDIDLISEVGKGTTFIITFKN